MNINWSSLSEDEILDSENEVYEDEEDWLGIYSKGKDEEIEDEEDTIGIGNKEEDEEVRDKEKRNRASEIVKAHNEGIMEGIDMMQKLGTKKQGKQEENKESRIKTELESQVEIIAEGKVETRKNVEENLRKVHIYMVKGGQKKRVRQKK